MSFQAKDDAMRGVDCAPDASAQRRKVLFVTSEITDYVQTGGLGEVSAALPRALRSFADVRILVPGYRQVLDCAGQIHPVALLEGVGDVPACALGRTRTSDGIPVYVVLNADLYDRPGGLYLDEDGRDWVDNDIRFARLSLAAAQIAAGAGDPNWKPDNLHLNDWPTALASGYLAWRGAETPTLLTIHNLAYQGVFDPARRTALGIPESAFSVNGVEFYGKLSFLKAGLFYADHLTTVSGAYAQEITTPQFGCGLHGLLAERSQQGRLTGILNGIDETWDPCHSEQRAEFDPHAWKGRHADYVRGRFGLALSRGPLFAIVSRLVHQKGVDLSLEVAEEIVADGGQLVVTGQGESHLEERLLDLAEKHPDQVGVRIGFDGAEARAMFAGSDFLLMPSRFEPCGLSQMYAQRFGSLPIAHRTGGLADTIEDGRTGFLFHSPTAGHLKSAVRRAFQTFGSGGHLHDMRRAAMSRTFGWAESARRYAGLYQSAG
ncbi:MAG: glycogen synthase GlgA [Hyphomicrobiales bacterium]|nr:glycogen synthase GlgA [Hyphomicrobiales bacterium]